MRVLITGITGFVGPYVATHIAETAPSTELHGLLWGPFDDELRGLLPTGLRLHEGDMTEVESLHSTLATTTPDIVVHLAAASSVARSWSHAARALEINAIGTANLLDAATRLQPRPIVVVASSAEVYGRRAPEQGPIQEQAPLAPVSPYGTSKAAQDLLAAQFFAGYGLAVIRMRPFHLTGPRRPAHFVASSFAHQIALIEHGQAQPVLKVGNLDSVRDITDVRDAAGAYWLAATKADPGEVFNLCSGRAVRIGDLLKEMLSLSDARIDLEVAPERLRADDIPWLVGDHTRLTEATGWEPAIPLRTTLADLLDWWRRRVSPGA